jgi:hypothetical protein
LSIRIVAIQNISSPGNRLGGDSVERGQWLCPSIQSPPSTYPQIIRTNARYANPFHKLREFRPKPGREQIKPTPFQNPKGFFQLSIIGFFYPFGRDKKQQPN